MNPLALLKVAPTWVWWLVAAGALVAWHLADVRRHEQRGQAAGRAEVQAKWDAETVRRQAAALEAERMARAEDQRRQAAMLENAHETQRIAARNRADARYAAA